MKKSELSPFYCSIRNKTLRVALLVFTGVPDSPKQAL